MTQVLSWIMARTARAVRAGHVMSDSGNPLCVSMRTPPHPPPHSQRLFLALALVMAQLTQRCTCVCTHARVPQEGSSGLSPKSAVRCASRMLPWCASFLPATAASLSVSRVRARARSRSLCTCLHIYISLYSHVSMHV